MTWRSRNAAVSWLVTKQQQLKRSAKRKFEKRRKRRVVCAIVHVVPRQSLALPILSRCICLYCFVCRRRPLSGRIVHGSHQQKQRQRPFSTRSRLVHAFESSACRRTSSTITNLARCVLDVHIRRLVLKHGSSCKLITQTQTRLFVDIEVVFLGLEKEPPNPAAACETHFNPSFVW